MDINEILIKRVSELAENASQAFTLSIAMYKAFQSGRCEWEDYTSALTKYAKAEYLHQLARKEAGLTYLINENFVRERTR